MSTTPKQVWPLVIKDMIVRNEMGAEKYNRYLQTDCPDNMLQHLYEELLDASVYIKTQIEKQKLNAVKREEEKITNGLKEISGMDTQYCGVSGCRKEYVQRDFVPSTWFIF